MASIQYLAHLDLKGNQLRNFVIHPYVSDGAGDDAAKPLLPDGTSGGQMQYDVNLKKLQQYDGTQWAPLATGGDLESTLDATFGQVQGTKPINASYNSTTNILTLTVDLDDTEDKIKAANQSSKDLATGYAVKEYAQHQVQQDTTAPAPNDTRGDIGDIFIVPEIVDTTVTSGGTNAVTSGAVYEHVSQVRSELSGRIDGIDTAITNTINTELNNIKGELATVYQVKGAITSNTLPSAQVGDVQNINVGSLGLDISDYKEEFIDPPLGKYLPNGTNIVYVRKTDSNGYTKDGWDVMGGVSSSGFKFLIEGNGSTPTFTGTHNLGQRPTVQVQEVKIVNGVVQPGERVIPGIAVSDTSVVISFNTAPAAGKNYEVICTV